MGMWISVERPASGGRPLDGAKIYLQTCADYDDYSTWVYSFPMKSLSLAKWHDLCLDMSTSTSQWVMHPCTPEKGVQGVGIKTGGLFGWGATSTWYDQVVCFERPDRRFGVPAI